MSLPPFQVLLDQHGPAVHRFLLASVGATDADDCYQEACIAALRAYPDLEHGQNLKGWLMTVAHRKAVDAHRARARRPVPVERVPEQATGDRRAQRRRGPALGPGARAAREAARRRVPAQRRRPVLRRRGDRAGVLAGRRPAQRPRGAQAAAPGGALVRELNLLVAERAQREGLLDVAYATVDSPFGPLTAAATERGPGHARLPRARARRRCWSGWPASCRRACWRRPRGWTGSGASWTSTSRAGGASSTPRWTSRSRAASTARCWRPRRRSATGRPAPTRAWPPSAGNAKAVRAAGSGLGSNPIPVVVPCHRVLRTGGALGGYTGGLERKEFLLSLERR